MMESTFNDTGRSNHVNSNTVDNETQDEAQRGRSAAGQEVSELMADVQDLLGRLAHIGDPDVARLRLKVEGALSSAKAAIAQGSARIQRQTKDALNAGDGYVREQPWRAVGIAATAGILVGFLVGRR